MIKAAIIDDGVTYNLAENWEIVQDSVSRFSISSRQNNRNSHADTCFKIIQRYLNKDLGNDIVWYNIKIFGDGQFGNIKSLLNALHFCLDRNIQVIHLSLGTRHFSDFSAVRNVVEELILNGTHVIAAASNSNEITYPACLPCVLGVKCNDNYIGDQFHLNHNPYDGIQFSASSNHRNEPNALISNSFAAPLISSMVLNYLKTNPTGSFCDILNYLSQLPQNQIKTLMLHYAAPRICSNPRNALILNLCPETLLQNINLSYDFKVININNKMQADDNYKSWQCAEKVYLYIEQYVDYLETTIVNILGISTHINVITDCSLVKQKIANLSKYYPFRIMLTEDFEDINDYLLSAPTADIPVVIIYGQVKEQLLNIIQYLLNCFMQNGYYCVSSADFALAKLIGLDVIPHSMGLENYVNHSCSFFRCDILLIGLSDNRRIHDLDGSDYLIVADNGCSLEATDILICDFSSEDYDALFQKLLTVLT